VETLSPRTRALIAVAALWAGAAPHARGDDLSRCTLRVVADPPALILGERARATLRIETGGGAPRITVSAGRLEAARHVAPGVFTAEFVPPDEAVPQLAIVSAVAGDACGWTAIRLVGQGEAIVRSSPRARIVVRIAERMFGPALADCDGVARLPVVVPPGVHFAYHGSRAIPLSIPPIHRVHIVVDPTSARADLDTDAAVRIFATTEEGLPLAGARIAVTTSAGEVPRMTEIAPGELVGRWHVPAGPARDETLTARIAGDPPVAAARLSRSVGPVAKIDVAPQALAAGTDVERVQIEVRTSDAAGNPVDTDVAPTAEPGAASRAVRLAAGVSRFSVRLPADAGGRDRVEIAAVAGGITARSAISLIAGAPARITTALSDPVLAADGRTTGELRFAVVDARGVPAREATPAFRAAELAAALRPERPGHFVLSYRSPLRADDATAVLRVDAAGLSSASQVRLLGARSQLEIAPSFGVALTRARALLETSVHAVAWTRRLGPDLGAGLELGWSAASERAPAAAGTPALEADARYFRLLARGGWRRATSRRALLWVSLGAGATRASSSMRLAGIPSLAEAAWVPSAAASVAWGIRAWRGFPYLELGARWQADPHLTGLSGAVVPLTVSAGYRLEVF
jgi:hypothetical protein